MDDISILKNKRTPYFVKAMNKATPFHIDLLKCIALVAMITDHVNDIILPKQEFILYSFGRLAMPLFVFIWAWNMAKQPTRWASMARRQWVWALVAQPFFSAAFYKDEPWYAANILFVFAAASQFATWVNDYADKGFKRWIDDQGVIKSVAWILTLLTVTWSVSIASYGFPGLALLGLTLICFLRKSETSSSIMSFWWAALLMLNISPSTIIAEPIAVIVYGIIPTILLPWGTMQIIEKDQSNLTSRFMPKQAFYWLYAGHLGFLAFCAWVLTHFQ